MDSIKQEVTSSVNGHDRKHTKENIDGRFMKDEAFLF